MFGECGPEIESRASSESYLVVGDNCERGSECQLKAMRTHKFYLAFETRNCTDYITEKFWRSLDHDLIPVVIQPSRRSYERLAPPNSFIHASDFGYDPKKLATYLEKVSSDSNLYSSYLKWKKDFAPLYKAEDIEPLRICELCFKLNNEINEPGSSVYTSVSDFFNRQCVRRY